MSERFPKCFTLTCDNPATGPKWFCPDCEAVLEGLAMRDKERAAEKAAARTESTRRGRKVRVKA